MNEQQPQYRIRPTLVVGLGGTGQEIAVRLKMKLQDALLQQMRLVRILVLDTDPKKVNVVSAKTRKPVELSGEEFIHAGGVSVKEYLDHLEDHPYLKWLPKNIPTSAITEGAKGVRPLGRMALHVNYQLKGIAGKLQGAINDLLDIRNLQNEYVQEGIGLNAFVVASTAGGTGSGMFLDTAYLIRYFAQRLGLAPDSVFVYGILVMPQAFAGKVTGNNLNRISANTFAALRELDFFMSDQSNYRVEFHNQPEVNLSQQRPFTVSYLIDAVNQNGQTLAEGLTALAPMIADYLLVHITSQVGRAGDAALDNVLDNLDASTEEGDSSLYSSLGIAVLRFPAAELINACAARLVKDLIRHVLARKEPVSVTMTLSGFRDRVQLTHDALLDRLVRSSQNKQRLSVSIPESLDGIRTDSIQSTANRRLGRFEQEKLQSEFPQEIIRNRRALLDEYSGLIADQVDNLLNDVQGGGVQHAAEFLDALIEHLGGISEQVTKEIADSTKAMTKHGEIADRYAKEVGRLANSDGIGGLLQRRQLPQQAKMLIVEKREEFRANLDNQLQTALSALVADLVSRAKEQINRVGKLQGHLTSIAAEFENDYNRIRNGAGRQNSPFILDITDTTDIDRYYTQYTTSQPEAMLPRMGEDIGATSSWTSLQRGELKAALEGFGQFVFAPLSRIRLEDVIAEKAGETPAEVRLELLFRMASPLWNFIRARAIDAPREVRVLGVDQVDNSLFKQYSLAPTNNPHEMIVVQTSHGIKLKALRQYEEWKSQYERVRDNKKQEFSLHAFQLDPEENKQWFVLGQALGFITQRGAYYSFDYDPDDPLNVEVQLGSGLRAALTSFMADMTLVAQAKDAVDKRIAKLGTQEACKILMAYVGQQLPGASDSDRAELERELRLLAKTYAKEVLGCG